MYKCVGWCVSGLVESIGGSVCTDILIVPIRPVPRAKRYEHQNQAVRQPHVYIYIYIKIYMYVYQKKITQTKLTTTQGGVLGGQAPGDRAGLGERAAAGGGGHQRAGARCVCFTDVLGAGIVLIAHRPLPRRFGRLSLYLVTHTHPKPITTTIQTQTRRRRHVRFPFHLKQHTTMSRCRRRRVGRDPPRGLPLHRLFPHAAGGARRPAGHGRVSRCVLTCFSGCVTIQAPTREERSIDQLPYIYTPHFNKKKHGPEHRHCAGGAPRLLSGGASGGGVCACVSRLIICPVFVIIFRPLLCLDYDRPTVLCGLNE